MPANLNKNADLRDASLRAWCWLQNQAEYKKDFSIQKRNIKSGQLPDFPEGQIQCEMDLRCDKRNPGFYYCASKRGRWFRQKQYNWELRDQLRNKWLFYPLSVKKKPSLEFMQGFEEVARQRKGNVVREQAAILFDKDLWESILKNHRPSMIQLPVLSKRRLNSEEIYIRIFLKASDTQIFSQLKEILKNERNKSRIKEIRPRFKNLDKTYIGWVSKSLGIKQTASAVELYQDTSNLNDNSIDKFRKRLSRATKR